MLNLETLSPAPPLWYCIGHSLRPALWLLAGSALRAKDRYEGVSRAESDAPGVPKASRGASRSERQGGEGEGEEEARPTASHDQELFELRFGELLGEDPVKTRAKVGFKTLNPRPAAAPASLSSLSWRSSSISSLMMVVCFPRGPPIPGDLSSVTGACRPCLIPGEEAGLSRSLS